MVCTVSHSRCEGAIVPDTAGKPTKDYEQNREIRGKTVEWLIEKGYMDPALRKVWFAEDCKHSFPPY